MEMMAPIVDEKLPLAYMESMLTSEAIIGR